MINRDAVTNQILLLKFTNFVILDIARAIGLFYRLSEIIIDVTRENVLNLSHELPAVHRLMHPVVAGRESVSCMRGGMYTGMGGRVGNAGGNPGRTREDLFERGRHCAA